MLGIACALSWGIQYAREILIHEAGDIRDLNLASTSQIDCAFEYYTTSDLLIFGGIA